MHEHYDPEQDQRWPCAVLGCLIPEVAPRPPAPGPRPPVTELSIPELLVRLADAEARAEERRCARCGAADVAG